MQIDLDTACIMGAVVVSVASSHVRLATKFGDLAKSVTQNREDQRKDSDELFEKVNGQNVRLVKVETLCEANHGSD